MLLVSHLALSMWCPPFSSHQIQTNGFAFSARPMVEWYHVDSPCETRQPSLQSTFGSRKSRCFLVSTPSAAALMQSTHR